VKLHLVDGGVTAGTAERVRCPRCLRAESVCWCRHLPALESRTHVLILQHPRERDVAIGTARMAHLALPGSELRIGVDFSNDPVVAEALRGPALLLYPGRSAVDLDEVIRAGPGPEGRPLTLVVVDGTWANARKLLSRNPRLAALPQVRFTPPRPGEYRIRREPAPHCVATIEALAHVLGQLEGDPGRFEALLVPFRAMVETQLRHQASPAGRLGGTREKKPLAGLVTLAAHSERVVCVHGEASAWPAAEHGAPAAHIVQWLAVRLATSERFSAVIAPRGPLAPSSPRNLGLDAADLEAGESLASFAARFGAFLQDGDLLVAWRTYAMDVLDGELALLPTNRLDLRPIASQLARGRTGSITDFLARVAVPLPVPWAPGRAGPRIAALEAAARTLLGWAP
jgi:DTW domain-containing protein YfiP